MLNSHTSPSAGEEKDISSHARNSLINSYLILFFAYILIDFHMIIMESINYKYKLLSKYFDAHYGALLKNEFLTNDEYLRLKNFSLHSDFFEFQLLHGCLSKLPLNSAYLKEASEL